MAPIRLGIIGCGNMEEQHQGGFDEVGAGVRITATADIVKERAERAAQVVGADLAVEDYHDLLNHVDAVLVVLPHDLHHRVGKECLKAGKHVLMEKPLANSEADCLDLIHTATAEGRILMVAYCVRYFPVVIEFKKLLDEKRYGDVFQISIWTEQHTERYGWHCTKEGLGGGQFFSHGCHYVDVLLWLLGRPVRGYHLGTNYGTPWMEMEGTSNVALEFAGGPLGYHFGTWGAKGTRLGFSIHAHCTEGMVELTNKGGKYKLFGHTPAGEELLFEQPPGKNTQHEVRHFVDCVRNNRPALTDGPRSLQGLRVIWRLYEAEQKGVVADLRGLGLDEPWESPGLGRLPA